MNYFPMVVVFGQLVAVAVIGLYPYRNNVFPQVKKLSNRLNRFRSKLGEHLHRNSSPGPAAGA